MISRYEGEKGSGTGFHDGSKGYMTTRRGLPAWQERCSNGQHDIPRIVCMHVCVYDCIKRKTSFPTTGSVQYPIGMSFPHGMFCRLCVSSSSSLLSPCLQVDNVPEASKEILKWGISLGSFRATSDQLGFCYLGGKKNKRKKISHFNSAEDMSAVFFCGRSGKTPQLSTPTSSTISSHPDVNGIESRAPNVIKVI